MLTPPILDAVDAKRAFAEQFIVKHKNKRLQESFLAFARAIEQTMSLHSANNKRPIGPGASSGVGGSPILHSNLKYQVAVSQAERNAAAQTTVTHVGKPLAIPPSIAKRPPEPLTQASPQAAVANGAPANSTPVEKAAAEPQQKPVLRLVSRLFGGNSNNKR